MLIKEEIQKPAVAVIEAIKTLAGRQEIVCPECKGKPHGLRTLSGVGIYPYTCETCNGTRKIKGKWEWEPKWNDKVITDLGTVAQVTMIMANRQIVLRDRLDKHFYGIQEDGQWLVSGNPFGEHITPLLHWERIQKIMLSLGYKLYLRNPLEGATVAFVKIREIECDADLIEALHIEENIPSGKWHHALSFQPAIMQAVVGIAGDEK